MAREIGSHGLDVNVLPLSCPRFADLRHSGNTIIIASSSSTVIALTWGGVRFAWSSAHVLAPLIIGLLGIAFFLLYEARFAKNPLVSPLIYPTCLTPMSGMNRCRFRLYQIGRASVGTKRAQHATKLSDLHDRYFQTFFAPVVMMAAICK